MEHGKRLWVEDECTRHDPAAEILDDAWKRLCNEELPPLQISAVEIEDLGDGTLYRMPNGHIILISYDGTSIYAPKEPTKTHPSNDLASLGRHVFAMKTPAQVSKDEENRNKLRAFAHRLLDAAEDDGDIAEEFRQRLTDFFAP
jgi:hypothetical protein